MTSALLRLYQNLFAMLERFCHGWFLGLTARFVFLAVLFVYYLNSATLKVGDGITGFFQPGFSAYVQILSEQVMSRFDFDASNVPFYLDLVVYAGTYAEFILPVLIVLGLFTRIAAIGMIIFIAVQTYVDINLHNVDTETIGAWFDRDSASLIADQRTLWVFLLLVLVIKGAGAISLDRLILPGQNTVSRAQP
jgi:putative oxidoreductase